MIKKVLKVPVAVIQRGSFFLFQRRKKSPYKNYLGLLGGKIESGEDLKSALTREVFEESSLIVKDLHPVGLVSEFFYTKKDIYKVELFIFKATITKEEIIANDKEGDLIWVDSSEFELLREEFIPTDWLIVKRMLDGDFSNFEIKVFENNYRYSVISSY